MNYTELLIAISVIIVVTVVYFLLRRFIAWAIADDDKWNKKHGYSGLSEKTLKIKRQIAYSKLSRGYWLIMLVVVLYIIKLFVDAT